MERRRTKTLQMEKSSLHRQRLIWVKLWYRGPQYHNQQYRGLMVRSTKAEKTSGWIFCYFNEINNIKSDGHVIVPCEIFPIYHHTNIIPITIFHVLIPKWFPFANCINLTLKLWLETQPLKYKDFLYIPLLQRTPKKKKKTQRLFRPFLYCNNTKLQRPRQQ